jgi:hypothetical protein
MDDEASAKVRTGGPMDKAADYDLPYWAGVLPLTVVRGEAQPDIPSTDGPRKLEKQLGKHQQG